MGKTLESLARKTTPPRLPPFLALPLSLPIFPLHSPSTRWTTDRNGVSISTVCTATAPLSRSKTAKAAWCLDSRLRVYEQHSDSSTTRKAPVSEGLPKEANSNGDPRKTTETETRASWETVDACRVPGCEFPATSGCQPIKLELYPHVHTCTANYVRVHFRHLGVYKGSRVAYRAIPVRVS